MRRYYDFNSYLKDLYGERVQKISLDAGLGCPNRDGTLSTRGCIFCDSRGSGTGAVAKGLSIEEQIAHSREFLAKRFGARRFIAYFQAYSNTYAPLPVLKDLYDRALQYNDIIGLSIATRPDCVGPAVLGLLGEYNHERLVWIEYGLQSCHDETLTRINRGHDAACFERAVFMAKEEGLNVCAHVILGLPGEDRSMMLGTARYLSRLPVDGIKIHLLYVVRGSALADLYERGVFSCLGRQEYAELVTDFLEILPSRMVIHRLTGDPVRSELLAPRWATEKQLNLETIRKTLERRNAWQGKRHEKSTAAESMRTS